MATFTASWTENQVLHASSAVADAASAEDEIDLAAAGYYAVDILVDLDIAAGTPDGNVTIELFPSVNSSTSFATEAAQTQTVYFGATATKRVTLSFSGPYVKVKVTNNTGASVTYVGAYAGLKQVSA